MNSLSFSRKSRTDWFLDRGGGGLFPLSSPKKEELLTAALAVPMMDLSRPDLPKMLLRLDLFLNDDLGVPKPPVAAPEPSVLSLGSKPKCCIILFFCSSKSMPRLCS